MNPLESINKQACSIWTQHLIVCRRTPWLSCFMTEKLKSRQTSTHTEYRVQKAFITQIETEKRLNIDSLKAMMRRKVARSQSKISLHVASVKSLRMKLKLVFDSLSELKSWQQKENEKFDQSAKKNRLSALIVTSGIQEFDKIFDKFRIYLSICNYIWAYLSVCLFWHRNIHKYMITLFRNLAPITLRSRIGTPPQRDRHVKGF